MKFNLMSFNEISKNISSQIVFKPLLDRTAHRQIYCTKTMHRISKPFKLLTSIDPSFLFSCHLKAVQLCMALAILSTNKPFYGQKSKMLRTA